MLAQYSSLSEKDQRDCDENIFQKVVSLEEYKAAKRVFVYISVGKEVSTEEITEKLFSDGKEVYVPLCFGKGVMEARHINSKSELKTGRYGIPEPDKDSERAEIAEIDFIIVPGVAFGEDGSRLGRGGGYYDRFMALSKNAKKVALCREMSLEKTVPCEEHDQFVDIVVTEKRIIKIR